MDIEELIEQLKYYGTTYAIGDNLGKEIDGSDELMLDAATALSTLQIENQALRNAANGFKDENEKLWAEIERIKRERDAAIQDVLDAAITPCSYCKRNPINGGNCDMDNDTHEMYSCWEWCGLEKED